MSRLYLYTPRLRCTTKYKRPSFGVTQLSTLQHFVLALLSVTLYTSTALRSTPVDTTLSRSILSYHLNRHKNLVPALGGRVLFRCSLIVCRPVVQIVSSDPLLPKSLAAKRRADDHCHVASPPVQLHRKKERRMDSGLQPKQEDSQVNINVDGVLNLRLASVALGTARCPCGTDDSTNRLTRSQASRDRHFPTCPCARCLTAPPRCEPSTAQNLKWHTLACQKRWGDRF